MLSISLWPWGYPKLVGFQQSACNNNILYYKMSMLTYMRTLHICVCKYNPIWIYLSYIHQDICNWKNILLEGIEILLMALRPRFKYPKVCFFSQLCLFACGFKRRSKAKLQDLLRKIRFKQSSRIPIFPRQSSVWVLTTHWGKKINDLSPSLLMRSPDSCRFFENDSTWLRISIGMYTSTSGRWRAWQLKEKQLIFTVGWTALWMNPTLDTYPFSSFSVVIHVSPKAYAPPVCGRSFGTTSATLRAGESQHHPQLRGHHQIRSWGSYLQMFKPVRWWYAFLPMRVQSF